MILKVISTVQIYSLPARIGFNDHVGSFPDPSISRLGVMHRMNTIHEVDFIFRRFLLLYPFVFLYECLLGFNISLARNVFGLLVGKLQLVQKARHSFGSVLSLESLLYKGADLFYRKVHGAFKVFDKLCQLDFGQFTCTPKIIVFKQLRGSTCDIGLVPTPYRGIIGLTP